MALNWQRRLVSSSSSFSFSSFLLRNKVFYKRNFSKDGLSDKTVLPVNGAKEGTNSELNNPTTEQQVVQAAASTPIALTRRIVYISSPALSAMQSGALHAGHWRIEFGVETKWENPLMGWISGRDPMQAISLRFPTKEEAIRFAAGQDWNYEIREVERPVWKQKSYSNNFSWSKDKLKFIRTK